MKITMFFRILLFVLWSPLCCNVFKCEDVIILAGYAFMLILYTLDMKEYMRR